MAYEYELSIFCVLMKSDNTNISLLCMYVLVYTLSLLTVFESLSESVQPNLSKSPRNPQEI